MLLIRDGFGRWRMLRLELWLREHFYSWFALATVLDLAMLGWIAWKMRH